MLALDLIKTNRQKHLELIEKLSVDQLNTIPSQFNNNLIWHFAHIVVTPELLCLKLSGLPFSIDETLIEGYKKGTRPNQSVSEHEIAIIKDKAFKTIAHLEQCFKDKPCIPYKEPYLTSSGITLNNSNEALVFCGTHEAEHLGFAKALVKLV